MPTPTDEAIASRMIKEIVKLLNKRDEGYETALLEEFVEWHNQQTDSTVQIAENMDPNFMRASYWEIITGDHHADTDR